jgi:probable addiction module antidote protein
MKREKHGPAVSQDHWLSEQLGDPELYLAYLNAALAEGDQAAFMLALRNVVKARGGVAAMARETGMNRVALNRALSETGNPELRSLMKILDASGLQLVLVSNARRAAGRHKRLVRMRGDLRRGART